jgi:hypothetical protein
MNLCIVRAAELFAAFLEHDVQREIDNNGFDLAPHLRALFYIVAFQPARLRFARQPLKAVESFKGFQQCF